MKSDVRQRVGIVAADPLRSVGLLAILEDVAAVNALPLTLEAGFERQDLAAVILDARSTNDRLTDAIARMRRERPGVKVIAMGEPLDTDHVQAVIAAGAKGYLAETAGESEIRMAIEIVLDGSVWAPRKVLARLIDAGGVPAADAAALPSTDSIEHKMTPRELEVLHLLMAGKSNRHIASAMHIDEVTVKAHLGRMLRKTGSSNRVELTLRAMDERKGRSAASPGQ